MEVVRSATEGDAPLVVTLLRETLKSTPERRAGHLFRASDRMVEPEDRVRFALADSDAECLVACLDSHICGFALVTIARIARENVGVVTELFVEPAARDVGLGEMLLTAAIEWCKGQRCAGIDLEALPGDRNTKNLAERMGFSARTLKMHRRLVT